MTEIRLERGGGFGQTYAHPTHLSSRVIEEYGKMTEASIQVPHGDVEDLNINEGSDEVYLSSEYHSNFEQPMDSGILESPYNRREIWAGNADALYQKSEGEYGYFTFEPGSETAGWEYLPGISGNRWEVEFDFWFRSSPESGRVGLGAHGMGVNPGHPDHDWGDEKGGLAIMFDADAEEFELSYSDSTDDGHSTFTGDLSGDGFGDGSSRQDPYTARVVLEHDGEDFGLYLFFDGRKVLDSSFMSYTGQEAGFYSGTDTSGDDEVWAINNIRIEDDVFGGVLAAVENYGSEAELLGDSWERRARQAEPVPAGYPDLSEGEEIHDDELVTQTIDRVDAVEAGNIGGSDGGVVEQTFNHRSPAKVIRMVSEMSNVEPLYQPNENLDFTSDLTPQSEEDQSKAQELSRDNLAFDGELSVDRDRAANEYTHLRMLGADSGEGQITTTSVADSYSEGDVERWTMESATSVDSESDLQRIGDTYIKELNSRHLEVRAVVRGYRARIGYGYLLTSSRDDLEEEWMRPVKVERLDSDDGVRYEVIFSNQAKTWYSTEQSIRNDVGDHNRQ